MPHPKTASPQNIRLNWTGLVLRGSRHGSDKLWVLGYFLLAASKWGTEIYTSAANRLHCLIALRTHHLVFYFIFI